MSFGWYVSANDIKNWTETNKKTSEVLLPELIRRLVVASIPRDKIKQLDFPAGDSTSTTGFDGFLETDVGYPFVSEGLSVWEIGTQIDVKGKADDDYQKRTKNSAGINKKKCEYVSATSRTWRDKQKWVTEKQNERKWKSVRGINANDLATWLSQCHSVHIWFSRLIGKRVGGDCDVDEAWDAWRTATDPTCVSNIIIAGRDEEAEKFVELLKNPSSKPIQIISQSIDESFAFILAVLKTQADFAPRVLIVKNQESWDSLLTLQEKLILIPDFYSAKNFGLAVNRGHIVIVPKASINDPTGTPENNILTLSPPNQESLTTALIEMGFAKTDIEILLTDTHGHLGPLRRHPLLHNQNTTVPAWITKKSYRNVLLGQMLVGSWDNSNQNDCQKISNLAGVPCEDLKSTLHILSGMDDPPVRLVYNKWISLSRRDLWYLLSKYIDEPLLKRFQEVVFDVLEENDPSFALEPDKRWLASIYQKNLSNSDEIRSGISNMVAILATFGETDCVGIEFNLQHYADFIVRKLFANATDQRWYSLKKCLSPLAEASPEIFLESLENGLKDPKAPVMKLFEPEDQFGHSGHCYLLWALECIAWDMKNLSRTTRALAKLSIRDPGGKYTNRPFNSLIEIYRPEFPQTIANVEERLKNIDYILKFEPAIAWKLLVSLLPDFRGGIISPICTPQYRSWAKSWVKGTSRRDYEKFSLEISRRILQTIITNPNAYWSDAIEFMDRFPNKCLKNAMINLESDIPKLKDKEKQIIRDEIRKIVNPNSRIYRRPKKYAPEIIAHLKAISNSLESDSSIYQNLFLFNNESPPISSKKEDIHKFFEEVEEKRRDALEIIWTRMQIDGIKELIEHVQNPIPIGINLAQISFSDEIETDVLEWLRGNDTKLDLVAKRYIYVKTSLNLQWPSKIVKNNFKTWTNQQKIAFCLGLPPSKPVFTLISSLNNKIKESYWKHVGLYLVEKNPECVTYVIKKYLKYSRPIPALRIAGLYFRDIEIDPNLIAEILEAIATLKKPKDLSLHENLASEIIELLQYLESNRSIPDIRLAKIEMLYMLTYEQNEIEPKVVLEEINRKPTFFVELVCMAYKSNPTIPGEFSGISKKNIENRARVGHSILNQISMLPSLENNTLDPQFLNFWVDIARQGCLEKNRSAIGDQCIGQVLAHSLNGTDGIWPHEFVREIFERCESPDLELGFFVGLRNQRGVTKRELLEGGKQERVLFEKYDKWAKGLRHSYPRTSNVLQGIANEYSSDAVEEDREVVYQEHRQ